MHLADLLAGFYPVSREQNCEVRDITLDSREVTSGVVFFALNGENLDGRQYIGQALEQGAAAIIYEHEGSAIDAQFLRHASIPLIPIAQLREKISPIAANFYQHPADNLNMIGITGTNGKTSCSNYIAQLLSLEGHTCGVIGTLGHGSWDQLQGVNLTTPDPIKLQSLLTDFYRQKVDTISMEVSSHGIAQSRITGIPFKIGVFTNLSQDHLDYHHTMEAYAAVKQRFLTDPLTQQVVLNDDDDYARRWYHDLKLQKSVWRYAIQPKNLAPDLTYAANCQFSMAGIQGRICSPWGNGNFTTPLVGEFNLSNVLACVTTLAACGIPFQHLLAHLSHSRPVPGRTQTLGGEGQQPLIVVDYSHTPQSLEKALQTLRSFTQGHLLCVFGCGGNRDQGKRPKMAQIAEEYADKIIVTTDNPRHETPEAIAADIFKGFKRPEHVMIELNRSKAIHKSIQLAKAQDCILIAGKGAERYQQIGDEKQPFDDVATVQEFL